MKIADAQFAELLAIVDRCPEEYRELASNDALWVVRCPHFFDPMRYEPK